MEMDFLLLVLRKLLHFNSRYVKVIDQNKNACVYALSSHSQELLLLQIILMSATINCRQFAEYFATPICGRMIHAFMFEVEEAPYAIEEFYLDDVRSLLPSKVKTQDNKWLLIVWFQTNV